MNAPRFKSWNVLLYGTVFVLSFGVFVYLTFPYGVLKEAVTAQIAKASGLVIRVEEFGPAIPFGFKAKKIRISGVARGPSLNLDRVEVSISLLKLFIGRLGLGIEVTVPGNGRLNIDATFGLLRLFESNPLPSFVSITVKKFDISGLVAFATAYFASAPGTNPMVAPMLTKIGMKGALNGQVDFDLDLSNLPQSSGALNLTFADAALTFDDPALNLGEQKFEKAALKAALKGGSFDLDKTSGLQSQGMVLDLNGAIKLRPEFSKSLLDISINLKLDNVLKEQFGFILDMAGGTGGAVKLQVNGTLEHPNVATM